jgi:DNA invertase Pin-like site-specific DNA recombinase
MAERKITKIPPATTFPRLAKVGIYCRVSSNKYDQLRSIATQVSHLTRTVLRSPEWRFVDIYIDFESGALNDRPELNRLLKDCRDGTIDTVLTKSVSRLGRNTVDTLNIIKMSMQELFSN